MVVVTNMWLAPWAIATLSLSLSISIIILIVWCICWQEKKHRIYINETLPHEKSEIPEVYTLSEIILSEKRNRTFRSEIHDINMAKKNYNILVTKQQKKCKINNLKLETEYQLDGPEKLATPLVSSCRSDTDASDIFSCISSNSSKYSFYSTYPHPRKESVAETMRSAVSQVNLQDCIE